MIKGDITIKNRIFTACLSVRRIGRVQQVLWQATSTVKSSRNYIPLALQDHDEEKADRYSISRKTHRSTYRFMFCGIQGLQGGGAYSL